MTEPIFIQLNGKPHHIPIVTTVADLLRQLDLALPHIAVAINDTIIPRSRHSDQQIANGDRVDIIHAVGGG